MNILFFTMLLACINCNNIIKTSDFQDDDSVDTQYDDVIVKREVGVNSTVYTQLHQFFTHDGEMYKEIDYSEFSKKYASITNDYIDTAFSESKLTRAEKRQDYLYTILGDQHVLPQESLYDCAKARTKLINLVHTFIDEHEQEVRALCIGQQLKECTSKAVWAPGCCDLQLHKNCFQQCRNNQMHSCINLFCKIDWSESFYKNVLKKKSRGKVFVPLHKIRNTDCPLCMEPLISDHKKVDSKRAVIIDSNGITAGAKKTRFA